MIKEEQSQTEKILKYLKTGHTLTHLQAEALFKITRLAARVNDLRNKGYIIITETIKSPSSEARYARYKLVMKP